MSFFPIYPDTKLQQFFIWYDAVQYFTYAIRFFYSIYWQNLTGHKIQNLQDLTRFYRTLCFYPKKNSNISITPISCYNDQ